MAQSIGEQSGLLNITITKGRTYSMPFSNEDDPTYEDFTTLTWVGQVKNTGNNTVVYTGAVTALDATHAVFDTTATQAGLLTVGNKYEYSIYWTLGSEIIPFMKGNVTVVES